MGCRACETACARAHAGVEDIEKALLEGVHMRPRVHVVDAEGHPVPVQCQQCENAPCMAVCPSDALQRDEEGGPVYTVPDKCVGCKLCVMVCPFGAITWDEPTGCVIKCDVCRDLVEAGEAPFCVAACPTDALAVAQPDELSAQKRRGAAVQTVHVVQAAD